MIFAHVVIRCDVAQRRFSTYIFGLGLEKVNDHLQLQSKCLMVHVLYALCVVEVHAKQVAHSAEAFSDVVGTFPSLVQKYTCPDEQGMGGILVLVGSGNAGALSFYHLSDRGGNLIGGYVHQRCFLRAITANGHTVWLLQPSCPENHPHCAFDWA